MIKKEWTIGEIDSVTETEAKEMAEEVMEIKEHNIYFVDFGGYFGYSCMVFKNNHHIHYANDYQSHHHNVTKEKLKKIYVESLNNKLYTEAEIAEPLKDYDEYSLKSYFLHNYYGMRMDYVSIFRITKTEEEKASYEKEIEGMIYNPVAFAYMSDPDFVKHHVELLELLEQAKEKMSDNYEYYKKAFLYEMYNHEYGINWEADHATLSAFGNIQYHGDSTDALQLYFDELNFTEVQRKAYLDARKQYFKENN